MSRLLGWLTVSLGSATTGLQDGPASVVVFIDKLRVLVTVLVLREAASRRYLIGLNLFIDGTLAVAVP